MINIPGNWELAKALPTHDNTAWRRDEQWRLANEKAAELRAQGYTVTVIPGTSGAPVINAVPGGAA